MMKGYTVIKLSSWWSPDQLRKEVESVLNEKSTQGYEVISVSFVDSLGLIFQCFVTLYK